MNEKPLISIIGLGYVGLPLAVEFAKKYAVVGYDINKKRIEELQINIDSTHETDSILLSKLIRKDGFLNENCCDCNFNGLYVTSNLAECTECNFYIITVPTPIDDQNNPDLTLMRKATEMVATLIKCGDTVIYESTVYPGVTEDICIPIIESISGLKATIDFNYGYSPERINPGDKLHTLVNTVKIVSGCNEVALATIKELYESIIEAGVWCAPSVKVAEAAKVIENIQRDVNIALMNELSILFNRMGINTYDVIDAAATKWNFQKYTPGLVGGHCIGVDPYYMVYKARELNYHPHVINAGRYVNDTMGNYVAKQCVKKLIKQNKNPLHSKVLILGFTFKENVKDIRNTKVMDIYKELTEYGVTAHVYDPVADSEHVQNVYGITLCKNPFENSLNTKYDALIVAVAHNVFKILSENELISICNQQPIIIDVKGIFRDKTTTFEYWSL